MSIQADLEELVSRRPRTAEDAERIAEAAALLAEYHRLAARVQGLVGQSGQHHPAAASLAGLALHGAAERVLAEAGVPLHASELGKRMKARGWRHPRSKQAQPDQIVHQLAARLPRYPQFRRVAPQTFALTSWGTDYPGARAKAALPTALFRGHGDAVGQRAGTADDPISTEDAAWRSS